MSRTALITVLVIALLLAAGASGCSLSPNSADTSSAAANAPSERTPVVPTVTMSSDRHTTYQGSLIPEEAASRPTRESGQIRPSRAAPAGEDLIDVLLLIDSTNERPFDANFCKLAGFYGLKCRRVALDTIKLTDELLRDDEGQYVKLIGMSAVTLLRTPSVLDSAELTLLQDAIKEGGTTLSVSNVRSHLDVSRLTGLSAGAIIGAVEVNDSRRDWTISDARPDITREFTGQVITSTSTTRQYDHALRLKVRMPVTPLMSSTDDAGRTYPIFVYLESGAGGLFVDSAQEGESLDALSGHPFRSMYYDGYFFSAIMPTLFALRYSAGAEAWHNERNFANLTIGDGILTVPQQTAPLRRLDYEALLEEMESHDFHTTMALIPKDASTTDADMARLFRENPDRFSIVQHGNNHDGYEFYRYYVPGATESGETIPPRPFPEQEADIIEGLARMAAFREQTGIKDDRIMIFPWGISPEQTLVLLKRYNYLASINAEDVPLGATHPDRWDYGMYQANLEYGNFPTLTRRHPSLFLPSEPYVQPFIFDLFLDKPALFYAPYAQKLFDGGIDTFSPVADELNAIFHRNAFDSGTVEWRSLGYILRHLYLQKTNDDGSIAIKMYGNHLIIENDATDERTYHVSKQETLNVPIGRLTVNGEEFPYRVDALHNRLYLDMRIPPGASAEIIIQYGS